MKKSLIFSLVALTMAQVASASFADSLKNFLSSNKPFCGLLVAGTAIQAARYLTAETSDKTDLTTGNKIYKKDKSGTDTKDVVQVKDLSTSLVDDMFGKVCGKKGYISQLKGGILIGFLLGYAMKVNKTGSWSIHPSEFLNLK